MKVLVVGGGGREHSLVWKIAQSPKVKKIYAAPGNAGISQLAECIPTQPTQIDNLVDFAERYEIDLTVVGPEAPLVAGIVDRFQTRGLRIFGPSKQAARLEGSKAFAKELMREYGIPTAQFRVFNSPTKAISYIREKGAPIVVKADGLAAGKGSIVAMTEEEASEAVEKILVKRAFGEAGEKVVIEEYLQGEEASVLALTDGETIVPLVPSQDHKRALDGDQGPNTGGMGAYAPAPVITEKLMQQITREILQPTVKAMADRGVIYKGVLYAGLIMTAEGPKVLEFNCRFGDPETQAQLPLMKTDLVDLLLAICNRKLKDVPIQEEKKAAVCVVMASEGYPGAYEKGQEITGLKQAEEMEGVVVFHAGTKLERRKVVTNGGRVLGVTAVGDDISAAVSRAYQAVEKIKFHGAHYRRDIAFRALVPQNS
ncbi:MAG: phosphoribosylamine--glycine ligase [Candidatus Latescibacterota bacterium]|nr:MAG: phosphoribosylamine--glycine ligase [Candidatus Latescibacterota bacterium]